MKFKYLFSFVFVLSQVFFVQAGDGAMHEFVSKLVASRQITGKKRPLDEGTNDQGLNALIRNKIACINKPSVSSFSNYLKLPPKEVAKQAYQNALAEGFSREEAKKIYEKEYQKEYKQSDAAKAAKLKYRKSDKGKAAKVKYRKSDKGKAAKRKYYHSDPKNVTKRKPYQKLKKSREESRNENQDSLNISVPENTEYESDNSIDQIFKFGKFLLNQNSSN
ncbi:MAG: hypothetical protein ACXWL2_01690 [Candidatus Chromulinivorax sp.]